MELIERLETPIITKSRMAELSLAKERGLKVAYHGWAWTVENIHDGMVVLSRELESVGFDFVMVSPMRIPHLE